MCRDNGRGPLASGRYGRGRARFAYARARFRLGLLLVLLAMPINLVPDFILTPGSLHLRHHVFDQFHFGKLAEC